MVPARPSVSHARTSGPRRVGAAAHTPEQLEIDLAWIEDEVGDRAYGVDVIVPAKYAGSDEGGLTMDSIRSMIPDEHRQFVSRLMEKYDVPPFEADDRPRRDPADAAGNAAPFSVTISGRSG